MTTGKLEPDAAPLVERLLEKSVAGRLNWEPTANRDAFVVSVGGDTTFRISTIEVEDIGPYGNPETVEVPVLHMLDEKGKPLWEVHQRELKGNALWDLYKIARRIGNQLDDRMASALKALEKLPG